MPARKMQKPLVKHSDYLSTLISRFSNTLLVGSWMSLFGCTFSTPNEPPALSEAQLQNCRDVGLSRSECLLVAEEVDRLREMGDFAGLKAAYDELRTQTPSQPDDMAVTTCRPKIESSAGKAKSCDRVVVTEQNVSSSL